MSRVLAVRRARRARRARRRTTWTVGSVHRRAHRGFSLAEIALALVLLAVVITLVAPRVNTASQAAGARAAQASLELVASAAVDYYLLAGTPPSPPSVLADLVPGVDLVGAATASVSPEQVSVSTSSSAAALAASDGEGFCWILIRHLVPSDDRDEVKIAVTDDGCTGASALAYATTPVPLGVGSSWSSPWTP